MRSPTSKLRTRWNVCAAMGLAAIMLLNAPRLADAQVVQGVEKGAREGNRAAGPVGGVLGGAIGGVVGVVTGVTGVLTGATGSKSGPAPAAKESKQGESKQGDAAKPAKGAKGGKKEAAKQQAAAIQAAAPQQTAEQIVSNSDANIERIKKELNLTPEQEKHWAGFNSAMHYLGHNGADRLNLRIARAKRDPPDDIIEQMRNEAQFLNDRAVDQRNVADAAEPLFGSLNDKQKSVFIQEMDNQSHERVLD
jgi:hypothetical protein